MTIWITSVATFEPWPSSSKRKLTRESRRCFLPSYYTYSRLSLSRIPRDSLKHFEISVPRHIRVAEVRKTINRTTTFNKWVCNLTPKVRNIYKIMWKRGEIAPYEQFLLFFTIFCYLFLDFHVKTGTRISLRYKRLFEISEVEITRVDCILLFLEEYYTHVLAFTRYISNLSPFFSSFLLSF